MTHVTVIQAILIQLVPIVVLLVPLLEAVGLTIYWRRSLSSPWLYGVLGVVLAYVVAAGAVFASEKLKPSSGTVITTNDPAWRSDVKQAQPTTPRAQESANGLTFLPFTLSWFALLGTVLVVCGIALWALKIPFQSSTP